MLMSAGSMEALIRAAMQGDVQAVHRMVGADPGLVNAYLGGITALTEAANRGHAEVVSTCWTWGPM